MTGLIALRFDAREGAQRWLFDTLIPTKGKAKTTRKWDGAAKLWIVEQEAFERACDKSYELVMEARAAGFGTAEFADAAEAFRESLAVAKAILPEYVHLYGRHFQQIKTNAATLPVVPAHVADEYLRQTIEGDF